MPENRLRLAPLFARFAETAKREGAVLREGEACRPEPLPDLGDETCSCGGESLFDLPVSPHGFKRGLSVRVCVVCDMGYEFPRYK